MKKNVSLNTLFKKETFLERMCTEKTMLHLKKQNGEDGLFCASYTQEDTNNLFYITLN